MIRQMSILSITVMTMLATTAGSPAQSSAPAAREPSAGIYPQNHASGSPNIRYGYSQTASGQSKPLAEASQKLRAAQQDLAKAEGDEAKKAAEEKLRDALDVYFDRDLEKRRAELEAIRQRVEEMEAQLERRVSSKKKIIDLRLQVILNDAAGLGWSDNSVRGNGTPYRLQSVVTGKPTRTLSGVPVLPELRGPVNAGAGIQTPGGRASVGR